MLISAIERYLELRRALGHKLKEAESMLRNFGEYAQVRGETRVTRPAALAWAAQATTARQLARRSAVVIDLAKFLHAEDSRHEIPPRPLARSKPPRPLPQILSAEQIQRLARA